METNIFERSKPSQMSWSSCLQSIIFSHLLWTANANMHVQLVRLRFELETLLDRRVTSRLSCDLQAFLRFHSDSSARLPSSEPAWRCSSNRRQTRQTKAKCFGSESNEIRLVTFLLEDQFSEQPPLKWLIANSGKALEEAL